MPMEPERRTAARAKFADSKDTDVTQTPPNEPEGRVVPFRRRGSLFTFNRPPPSPVQDLEKFERTEGEDDYRHRMMMNAMAAGVIILLIAGGIWIANSMAMMRKNQDCVLSGKRNCNPPVEVPVAPRLTLVGARERDRREPRERQGSRPCRRQIDDAAADERPAIVDPHHHRLAVALVGDAHHRAERQRAMRGGQAAGICALAARGF